MKYKNPKEFNTFAEDHGLIIIFVIKKTKSWLNNTTKKHWYSKMKELSVFTPK